MFLVWGTIRHHKQSYLVSKESGELGKFNVWPKSWISTINVWGHYHGTTSSCIICIGLVSCVAELGLFVFRESSFGTNFATTLPFQVIIKIVCRILSNSNNLQFLGWSVNSYPLPNCLCCWLVDSLPHVDHDQLKFCNFENGCTTF